MAFLVALATLHGALAADDGRSFVDGGKCAKSSNCDSGVCIGARCCSAEASQANITNPCSACTKTGACWYAPTLTSSPNVLQALDAAVFPNVMVGGGASRKEIEWNNNPLNDKKHFALWDILTTTTLVPNTAEVAAFNGGISFRLLWGPFDDEALFQVGHSPPPPWRFG